MKGDTIKLKAKERGEFSGSKLNKLRSEDKIPAVLYGPDVDNTPIIIDKKEFWDAISTEHGENALIDLKFGRKKGITSIIKEIQVDPVSMKILHVDFGQIRLTEKIEVEVPVEVEGEAPGVKDEGGVLEHIIHDLKIRCLPTEIPDSFVVDVSGMSIGDHVTVGDIEAGDDVEILAESDAIVINIGTPTEVEEPEEELEEEVEPEVIGKEKDEEEPAEEAEEEQEPSGKKEEE